MKDSHWLAVVVAVVANAAFQAAPARADLGFWPRPDVDIRVRFENLNAYPNYEFYLKYNLGGPQLTRLSASTLTRLEGKGRRVHEAYLLAVPRGEHVQPPPKEQREARDWLREKPQAGIFQSILPGVDRPFSEELHGYSIVYRVQIESDRVEIHLVDYRPPWSWWTVISVLMFSIAIALAMIVWRRRSRKLARQSDDNVSD